MNILTIDQNALLWLNGFFVGKNESLDQIVIFLGSYLVYALPIILILLWVLAKKQQRTLAFSMGGLIISWFVLAKLIIPNIWFRPRPDLSVIGAKELLFHRPDYSFPSDHTAALFAITFALYFFGYKKAANWFLLYSSVIAISRVALGVHFPLDIIAGVICGFIGAGVVKIFERPLDRIIWKPMIKFLRKICLA